MQFNNNQNSKQVMYMKKPIPPKINQQSSTPSSYLNEEDSSPIDKYGNTLYNPDYTHYVVHSQKSDYDVYIGRKNPKIDSRQSTKWGNPFKVGTHGDRNQCMLKYRDWIFHSDQNELFQQAKRELKGKILACWCSPLNCHGYILSEIANSSISNLDYKPVSKPLIRPDTKQTSILTFFTKKEDQKPTPSPASVDPNSWASLIQSKSTTPSTSTTTTNNSNTPTPPSKPTVDSEADFPTLTSMKKK